ncbi:carboxypeptidase regulatory-like domain-containing protein [Hymenobacter sp. M29]|uniref:Carboxypeptidase regulatory-like domain-containing protein n=1 Tax=Hymenobacter mellowenesis TaxID=3063995 RepID=A0ABT9A7T6_9BACT|nr:carboxypeptidase-like regulatory domain-containing protein [Hymenobacter sp. M29]MDO7845911.1 carboxypeptidase regulatory-like domain-containing protein [Hymenobacter sp. M29]
MKHLFQFLFLAFFAATTLVLSSCGDDKKTDPTPTTGTVNGQISPANSVTTVTATSSATPATTATATPNASGAYTFSNLAAGTYTLSFTPATGYATPATQTVTVTAGGTATATPVTATTSSSGGATLAYTINGTATTANLVTANVLFGSLVIQSSSSVGARGVSLSLDQVPTGPRTYTFGGAGSTSEISVVEAAGAGLAEWNTTVSGGTGTVTITSVSTNPRRASGTFSAVAQPRSGGASGTRTITTGTFSNVGF